MNRVTGKMVLGQVVALVTDPLGTAFRWGDVLWNWVDGVELACLSASDEVRMTSVGAVSRQVHASRTLPWGTSSIVVARLQRGGFLVPLSEPGLSGLFLGGNVRRTDAGTARLKQALERAAANGVSAETPASGMTT